VVEAVHFPSHAVSGACLMESITFFDWPVGAVHNKAKYVLNGPEDVTGRQIVKMVEQYIGTQVDQCIFLPTLSPGRV
jgi:hypothetical protein